MFTNYEKKLKKLILKKTIEKNLLQNMLDAYTKENDIGDKQRSRIENVLSGYEKELLACENETSFCKETYKQHKENFNEVVRKYM